MSQTARGQNTSAPALSRRLPLSFIPCGAIGAGALAASALSSDGSVLAVATLSGQLVLYRSADGSRLQTLWDLPGQALSPDSKISAGHEEIHTVLRDVITNKPLKTFELDADVIGFSPDGQFLSTQPSVSGWWDTGRTSRRSSGLGPSSAPPSHGPCRLATLGADRTVRFWCSN